MEGPNGTRAIWVRSAKLYGRRFWAFLRRVRLKRCIPTNEWYVLTYSSDVSIRRERYGHKPLERRRGAQEERDGRQGGRRAPRGKEGRRLLPGAGFRGTNRGRREAPSRREAQGAGVLVPRGSLSAANADVCGKISSPIGASQGG